MFPYKSIIQIHKSNETPVYLQIANAFAREIQNGVLKPGTKLPGARSLAVLVEVHRNTIAAVYEELSMQGYIELLPKKGAFISKRIPDIKPKPVGSKTRVITYPVASGFLIKEKTSLPEIGLVKKSVLEFNDGLPDERIAPLDDLMRNYRSSFKRRGRIQFGYSDTEGNPMLREAISGYLNETRGLQTTGENIFITKGSQMGIFLVSQLLLDKKDVVIVGETSYPAADTAFKYAGASLVRVKIDERGIDVDAIEKICKTKSIRAVYVTPHHHYPTTVTLSACRRMSLLALSERYGFAIIEDDYDYDFHYKSSPILPLASGDHEGMVINIGSLSKNFSPALRVAYIVAPKNVIAELAKLRFIIDRQGDYLLEQALAELFKEGVIKRHLRKALNIYHERRDILCDLLKTKLSGAVNFNVPDGGLAVWTEFDKSRSLKAITMRAAKNGLVLNDGSHYDEGKNNLNATRLGFASMNAGELEKAVRILSGAISSK
jgi:GntR family transcriptional regulator / MocR family aminotransferase